MEAKASRTNPEECKEVEIDYTKVERKGEKKEKSLEVPNRNTQGVSIKKVDWCVLEVNPNLDDRDTCPE